MARLSPSELVVISHHDDRDGARLDQFADHAPLEEMPESPVPMGAHHEKVRAMSASRFHEAFRKTSRDENDLRAKPPLFEL
jgi:hypothetical protein